MRAAATAYEMVPPPAGQEAGSGTWLHRCASHLLTAPQSEAISFILEMLGRGAGADRAWMLEYADDLSTFHTTHEWCRHGVIPFVEDLLNTPVTMIGWLHEALVAGKAVMVTDIAGMPRRARALRAEFERQGNKSVLSVPIAYKGRLRAFFGFDAVLQPRRWTAEQIGTLFLCGELIAAARYGSERRHGSERRPAPAAQPVRVYLRTGVGIRGIFLDDILGLRAEKDYSRIYLGNDSEVVDMHALKRWEAVLPRMNFARIHRSAIVNVSCVERLERRASGRWQLYLDGLAQPWNVSRDQVAGLRSRLGY